jgi:VanZ family protein
LNKANLIYRIAPAVIWAGLIFMVSGISGNSLHPPRFIPYFDKIAHFCVYTVLGALIFRAGKPEWVSQRALWWVVAACAIGWFYGASDEFHQLFVPQRTCSVFDWIFDALGATVGVFCWKYYIGRGRMDRMD